MGGVWVVSLWNSGGEWSHLMLNVCDVIGEWGSVGYGLLLRRKEGGTADELK